MSPGCATIEWATRSGPALRDLRLSDVERERLLKWTRRHKSAQALALRARIVLTAAEGHDLRVDFRAACFFWAGQATIVPKYQLGGNRLSGQKGAAFQVKSARRRAALLLSGRSISRR
jgi:hypothetical protein